MVREAFELELLFAHELDLTGDLRHDLILAAEALRFEMIERVGTRILIAMIANAEWDDKVAVMKKALVEHALRSLRGIAAQAISDGEVEQTMTVERVVSEVFGPMVMERLVTDTAVPAERVPQLVDAFLRAHATEKPAQSHRRRSG